MRQPKFQKKLRVIRDRLDEKYARLAYRVLRIQYRRVDDYINNLDILNPSEAIYNLLRNDDWTGYYQQLYNESGQEFGWEQLKQMRLLATKEIDEETFFTTSIGVATQSYAQTIMGTKITGINQTTRDRLTAVIQRVGSESLSEGLSIQTTARNIRRAINDDLLVSRSRSMTIARTEITNAQRYAQHQGALASGLEFRRFWSNSGLPDIRESHIFAQRWSEQVGGIRNGESFNMGNGAWLRFVGDPNAPAAEVINCRCTEIFEPIV